jgi:hypothetical protein
MVLSGVSCLTAAAVAALTTRRRHPAPAVPGDAEQAA